MLQINPGTIIWCFILAIIILSPLEKAFYALVFSSALTTVSFVLIRGECIPVHYMVFLICGIKYLVFILRNKLKFSIDKLLIWFVVWCFITIPFSLFHSNTIVRTVNYVYESVNFNYHQFTQYAYLLIGFLTCLMCNGLLINKVVSINSTIRVLEAAYIFTLSVALLQHVLPVSFVNAFLRNHPLAGYTAVGSRISGTFFEPSMLALYCTPLFASFVYSFFITRNKKHLICALLFFVVTLDNYASTAMLGMIGTALFLAAYFLQQAIKGGKIKKNQIAWVLLSLIPIVAILLFSFPNIKSIFESLTSKLAGEGVSGRVRTETLLYHLRLCGSLFLFPAGYGSAETGELFTTWVCNTGALGLALYLIPIIKLSVKLFKLNTVVSIRLLIEIFVHNLILFISCNDISFLSIWIIYGIAYYYTSTSFTNQQVSVQYSTQALKARNNFG